VSTPISYNTIPEVSLIQMGLKDYDDTLTAKFNIYTLNIDGERVNIFW